MNITILSGGSGNDALIKGLEKLLNKNDSVKIDVIVNAYDNGKSTGVCRAVTDTLGVSDIRKNHSRMYEATFGDKADCNIVDFYGKRFNFEKGKEVEQICEQLDMWKLPEYKPYVQRFFENVKANEYEYKDFSISNIVYAQMYKEEGYEKTNKHFCDKIGIADFVTLNSFDNVFIKAETESGHVIQDEGETVFWNNPNDKIVKTIYDVKTHFGLNPRAVKLVEQSDLIVISTGTFWSSIQPTIEYLGFYKHINNSKAKKIWVINNEEDGDSFGVNSVEFVKFMEKTGLNLDDFIILLNDDACPSLKMKDSKHHFVVKSMGNTKGKHNGNKYARALLQIYYGIEDASQYDKILFDFDDTIWSRDKSKEETSIENAKIVNSLSEKAAIVSGNSYESIHEKLAKIFGKNLENFNVDIWADANSTLYRKNKSVDFIQSFALDENAKKAAEQLKQDFNLEMQAFGDKAVVNFKIKPLSSLERKLLIEVCNLRYGKIFKGHSTGRTTVDILSSKNSKAETFKHCKFDKLKTLFVGDELEEGNDVDVAKLCNVAVQVDGVEETNLILNLLVGE